jgi:hypothetical protein
VSARCTRRITVAALLAGGIVAAPLVAAPAMAADGGKKLYTTLSGAEEVPGPGDPDGSGTASVRVNIGQKQVCVDLMVSNIAPAIGAHIHEAPAGMAGDVVVPLDEPDPLTGMSSGCYDVTRELAKDIARNPENYYVNVHTADFRPGAVRGQLSKP